MAVTLEILRKQLREKFPAAHAAVRPERPAVPAKLNPFAVETYPLGALSEVVATGTSAPLGLIIAGLLGDTRELASFPDFALVDGGDAFDPDSFGEAACSHLLWVRCASAAELLKAGELLIRDGNVTNVLLDACGLHAKQLRQIPSSSWWRLQQVAENSGTRVILLAPYALTPCARLRFSLSGNLTLDDLACTRREALLRIEAQIAVTRRHAK